MTTYISDPFIAFCILPLVATIIIAAAIRFCGGHPTDNRLISASAGVCIVWVTVLVLGMPEFPSPPGGHALPVILLVGLVLGSLLDQFLPVLRNRARLWRIVLDFTFVIGAVVWIRGTLDLWCLVIFATWGTLQIRAHSYTGSNAIPAVMMLLSAGGLALIAWIGGTTSDEAISLGVFSATLGLGALLCINRSLHLGYGYHWGGFTAQLLIALRIIDSNPALVAPIVVLGFIFYADYAAASLADWKPTMKKVPRPMLTGLVSIFPLTLAMVIAVAVSRLALFG